MATTRPTGAALNLDQLIATVDSATSEATGYRRSRLIDPIRSKRWRATGVTQQVLSGTLTTGALPTMLGLVDPNFATPAGSVDEALAAAALWLKADALGLADGTAVSSWTNAGTLGGAFTQGTGANQPTQQTNEIDSKAVVRFDSTDALSHTTTLDPFGPYFALHLVLRMPSLPGGDRRIVEGLGSDLSISSTGQVKYNYAGSLTATFAASLAHSTAYVLSLIRNATSLSLYRNGELVSTESLVPGGLGHGGLWWLQAVGSATGSLALDADIAELILYSGADAITTANRLAIQDYLAAKWGISVPYGSLLLELADNSGFTTNPRRWALRTPTIGEPNCSAIYLGAADNGVTAVAPTHWRLTIPAGCTLLSSPSDRYQLGCLRLGTYRELVISPVDNEVENPSSVAEAADGTSYIDTLPDREVVPVDCELLTFDEANTLKEALRELGAGDVIYDQHASFDDEDVRSGAVYYGRLDLRRGVQHAKRSPTENAISFVVVEHPG